MSSRPHSRFVLRLCSSWSRKPLRNPSPPRAETKKPTIPFHLRQGLPSFLRRTKVRRASGPVDLPYSHVSLSDPSAPNPLDLKGHVSKCKQDLGSPSTPQNLRVTSRRDLDRQKDHLPLVSIRPGPQKVDARCLRDSRASWETLWSLPDPTPPPSSGARRRIK